MVPFTDLRDYECKFKREGNLWVGNCDGGPFLLTLGLVKHQMWVNCTWHYWWNRKRQKFPKFLSII